MNRSSLSVGKLATAFSSWFKIPEQGMKHYELLSRASMFLVPSKRLSSHKYHAVVSGHVIFPFHYPAYYGNEDWLSFVKEEHILGKMELQERSTMNFAYEYPLSVQHMYRHPTLDIAVLHFENDEKVEELAEKYDVELPKLELNTNEVSVGDEVTFVGIDVNRDAKTNEDQPIPIVENGKVTLVNGTQAFAKTGSVLQWGMCGGPVLGADGRCVGIIEAIALTPKNVNEEDLSPLQKTLRDNAVFQSASEINRLIDTAEQEMCK